MLRITLTKEGESPQVSTFDKREITVGRTNANDLMIAEPGVSSHHARILFTGDGVTIIDLESTNGTFVNGERIRGPAMLQPGDEVYICAFQLDFELGGGAPQASAPPAADAPPMMGQPPAMDAGPQMLSSPAPVEAPEYPTPADAGPPPLAGDAPPPLDAPPMMGGDASGAPPPLDAPPMMDAPPPMAPAPAMPPMMDAGGDAPPPLGPPPSLEAPPDLAPPGDLPPPLTPPPGPLGAPPPAAPAPAAPVPAAPAPAAPAPAAPAPAGPPGDLPPPLTPPAPASPQPVPGGEEERSSPSMVSGQISPPEPALPETPAGLAPPPAAPEPMPPAPSPEPLPPVSAPPTPEPMVAPAASMPAAVAPSPEPATAAPTVSHALGMAPAMAPAPMAVAAPAPSVPPPPSSDLSDLKGPNAATEACARVFALVHYHLAPDGSLPPRDGTTRAEARREAQRLFTEVAQRVPEVQARPWANRLANELCGLGALSAPLAEPEVVDIFVHGPDRVLVHREGQALTPGNAMFSCPAAVDVVVRRLTQQPFGPDHPMIDARTTDGADVQAIHGSAANPGPLVTIHRDRAGATGAGLESLLQRRALPSGMATLLHHCVQAGLNILVSGGAGARTFPWLAALAAEAPEGERQVVVRPGTEPEALPANAVVVQARSMPPADGLSSAQRAVRGAMGLAPDRLVAHEVSGAEASDVLAAMGRGLRGAVVSVRAATADGALARLSALAGLAGDAPDAAARARHVGQTVDLIIALSRFADGHTRVTQLSEVTVSSAGSAQAVDLVTFDPATGRWAPTGVSPSLFAQLQRRGIAVDVSLLNE
ncbi:MAG: ATPase, T2SS/T4P/T4SS family [Myxococcota bacterium]